MAAKKKRKRLGGEHKLVVVRCLARFMTPSEVAELLNEEYGYELSRQAVEKYDPTKVAGEGLGEELKQAFYEARKEFLEDVSNIDVASKSFRLVGLSKLYRNAVERGKDVIAAQHLEQAAKEVGGLFTNARVHSGPGGGAIPISFDDPKVIAARMLKKLMEKGRGESEARALMLSMGVDEHDLPAVQGS